MTELKGTWLVSHTYVDPDTKFLLTATDRIYGTFSDAWENSMFHKRSQDIRIQFYSPQDETGASKEPG